MSFGDLPVDPKAAEAPIIPTDKWQKDKDFLKKKYQFRLKEFKVEFVRQILDYETEVGHNATITIEEDTVTLVLQTKDIKKITELDKEYARYADELFRDIVYSVFDVGQSNQ